MIKQTIRNILEQTRLLPATKAITHNIHYDYNIVGMNDVIIPLPIETEGQKLLDTVIITSKPDELINQPDLSLAYYKNPSEIISIRYKVKTTPIFSSYKTDSLNLFLIGDNKFINSNDSEIKNIVETLKLNGTVIENIKTLYGYVLSNLTYANPIEGLYTYSDALKSKEVDCGGFCTLLASLLGSIGIKTRFVSGFLILPKSENNISMHVWLEALLEDNMVLVMDPSIDWKRRRGLTSRYGGFGFVGSDRIIYSYGVDKKIEINKKIYEVSHLQCPYKLNSL